MTAGLIDRWLGWLSLPPGRLPEIRRLVGGLLLGVLPEVWFWSHGGPGPYHVPAWKLGDLAIDHPLPPPGLDLTLWLAYAGAALALMLGRPSRAYPMLAAAILGYYGWRDNRACNSSYVQLLFVYLVALAFARDATCASRRLIQCGLTCCYVFSVIQKLAMPEWRLGFTLGGILEYGDGVRPAWAPLLRAMAPGPGSRGLLAMGVIGVEAFIAGGLWWRRARWPAMALGIGLHLGFAVVFPGTEIFAPVMFVGYLAFLDDPSSIHAGLPLRRSETILALAYLVAMVAIPARIYLPPMRPWELLSHMDHLPWTYSMFSEIDRVDAVEVSYRDARGASHRVEPTGRMREASSDGELLALARDVRARHPEAEAVLVHVGLTVNHRRGLVKDLEARRGEAPILVVRGVTGPP